VIDFSPLILTFKLSIVTVFILLIFGLPFAWWLAQTSSRFKPFLESITALPLVLPPTVLGFYMLILFGQDGALGSPWMAMTGSSLAFSFTGLVIASCIYSMPFVIQPLQTAFEKLDYKAIEAAFTLGASRIRTFLLVVIPMIRRGLITAFILGFAHTVGEFGVVLMVGGNIPGETQVISIAIYEAVETLNYNAAHLMSFGLLIFSMLVLVMVYSLNRRWSIN